MRKIFGSIVVVAACFTGLVAAMGGGFLLYLNIPSLIIVLVLPLLYQNMLFGLSGFVAAFSAPFREDDSREDLARALAFFASLGRSIWLFAIAAALLGLIGALANSADSPDLGPYLALSLISPLYAALLNLMLVHPFTTRITSRMAKID